MRFFGLTPDQVLARSPQPATLRPPSLAFSILYGAISLGLVSLAAYSIWAFRVLPDRGPLYAATAAVYIGLGGLALSWLVVGPGSSPRFAGLFAVAFLAYAIAWCAFWFGLRGKHQADLWGAVAGLALITWILRRAFEKRSDFFLLFGVLLAFHSLGYYLGEMGYARVPGRNGRLLWGAVHGLGFGAGLGFVLYHAQAPLKNRLRPA